MAPKAFFVAAKNLVNKKLKCEHSLGFYRVYDNDTYKTYKPAHGKDFEERKHYGRIFGQFMHLYYILGIDGELLHSVVPTCPHEIFDSHINPTY